jgi:photosystem II stability/assembly factor-like uncharacterized protein
MTILSAAARVLSTAVFVCAIDSHALWEKVYTGDVLLDRLPVLEHAGKIYMSTQKGLIVSPDTKTWDITKTVYGGVVSQMISEGDTLWAATRDKGVQFTVNDAQTWTGANQGLGKTDVRGLVRMQGELFAATLGGGMYRSRDNAKTWEAVNTGLPDLSLNCVEVVGAYVFAGTSTKGVYRSKDHGDHWEAANTGFNGKGSFLFATDGTTLFSVAIDHKAVVHSPDLGASWNTDTTGMGVAQFPHALDDYGTNVYWVHDRNVNGGVHITTDGGKTWSNINKDPDPHRIERPKAAGFGLGYMIVGSANYGIWRRPMSELNLGPGPSTASRPTLAPAPMASLRAEGRSLYLIGDGSKLRLSLFDPQGVLLGETRADSPGLHRWDLGSRLPSGILYYRMEGEGRGRVFETGAVKIP